MTERLDPETLVKHLRYQGRHHRSHQYQRSDIMKVERLEIGGTLAFEVVRYETVEGYQTPRGDASFEFVEHSPAHGYSDTETSIDVDEETARKLVAALSAAFGFAAQSAQPLCELSEEELYAMLLPFSLKVMELGGEFSDNHIHRYQYAGSVERQLKNFARAVLEKARSAK